MKQIVRARSNRHMTRLLLLLSATLALSSTAQAVDKDSRESVVSANPTLVGRWTGAGSFLDVKLDKEIGKVPLEVEIHADGTVSGGIGDAKLTQTSAALIQRIGRTTGGRLRLAARLRRAVLTARTGRPPIEMDIS